MFFILSSESSFFCCFFIEIRISDTRLTYAIYVFVLAKKKKREEKRTTSNDWIFYSREMSKMTIFTIYDFAIFDRLKWPSEPGVSILTEWLLDFFPIISNDFVVSNDFENCICMDCDRRQSSIFSAWRAHNQCAVPTYLLFDMYLDYPPQNRYERELYCSN